VKAAVVRIGVQEVANIVLMTTEKKKYNLRSPALQNYTRPLWKHAVGVGLGAQWLAKRMGFEDLTQRAFMAGLLHDVGKLLLLCILDDLLQNDAAPAMGEPVIEELLESRHAEEGHKLARQWNLPEEYARVIELHETEKVDGEDALLLLVRLANEACHRVGIGPIHDESIDLASTEEARQLCANEITLAELEIALEDTRELAG
jgi:HD-like signal output (HDOD) protein